MSLKANMDRLEKRAKALFTGECKCKGHEEPLYRLRFHTEPVPPPEICAKCGKPRAVLDVEWGYRDGPL